MYYNFEYTPELGNGSSLSEKHWKPSENTKIAQIHEKKVYSTNSVCGTWIRIRMLFDPMRSGSRSFEGQNGLKPLMRTKVLPLYIWGHWILKWGPFAIKKWDSTLFQTKKLMIVIKPSLLRFYEFSQFIFGPSIY